MAITDEKIERILELTAHLGRRQTEYWFPGKTHCGFNQHRIGTTESIGKEIRDIIGEPSGWPDGPPAEPGNYVIDCRKNSNPNYMKVSQDDIDRWHTPEFEGHITRHYGPIPEPPKPLPEMRRFICECRDNGTLNGVDNDGVKYVFGPDGTVYSMDEGGSQYLFLKWIDKEQVNEQ